MADFTEFSERPVTDLLIAVIVCCQICLLSCSPPQPEEKYPDSDLPPVIWKLPRPDARHQPTPEGDAEVIEVLRGVGYLSGYRKAPEVRNVTVYDAELAGEGLNLYISGHAPEATLMDMEGKVLHRWNYDYASLPAAEECLSLRGKDPGWTCWRRALATENGDLFAIYEHFGLIKIDKNSNPIWFYNGFCHHDLSLQEDGSIYVLNSRGRVVPSINPDEHIAEDLITILDSEGNELKNISLLECFLESEYAWMLEKPPRKERDLFHTNTLEVFDGSHEGRSPFFKKGNILVSILRFDVIAIIDPEAQKVVWAAHGDWKRQHQPCLLPNGNMLLFDNLAGPEQSKVIEFDPFTLEVFWSYSGGVDGEFYSEECGSCQRLANGNTLITESCEGRAFEVTPDKRIVWEFFNPHRAGENNELIAVLYEVVRLDPDFPTDWIE